MSTHSRLAAALALAFTLPAGLALADSDPNAGGTAYSASKSQKSAHTKPAVKPRGGWSLGDRVPLRQGMRGRDIKQLQQMISRIGIPVSIDGDYGRQTWAALRRIEKRGNRHIDGTLDAGDLDLVRRLAAQAPAAPAQPKELPPGSRAKVMRNGLAAAPADAPQVVKDIIAAGNEIASKPYVYGGGHGRWKDSGYDCSGSVSYALHGAGLLKVSRDSTGFESFGSKGYGKWVTIYANGGHAWMMVAGLRFDTSGLSSAGSRWQSAHRSIQGYVIRHPTGL